MSGLKTLTIAALLSATYGTAASAASPVSLSYVVNNQWGTNYCATGKVSNPNNEAVTWSGALN